MTNFDDWPSRHGSARERDHSLDFGTRFTALGGLPGRVPFEALFLAHDRSIRELARGERAGVGVVAVELVSFQVAGVAWVARRADRPNALTVGRHSQCDLLLGAPAMSLRHFAVIVPRRAHWPGQFSLHDLRTGDGLADGIGRPLRAARVEHLGMFSAGPYAFFAFATGAPEAWPELASDAWRDMRGAMMAVEGRPPPVRDVSEPRFQTRVNRIAGPLETTERLLATGEPRVAVVSVEAGGQVSRLALGPSALDRGVLLGRYPRCQHALTDPGISRVHLLVIQVGADIVGIDTASFQGVFLDAEATEPAHVVVLSHDEAATLGRGLARVTLSR